MAESLERREHALRLNAIAHCYGMTLAEVAQANIGKLKARYPDGFECDRSINRTV